MKGIVVAAASSGSGKTTVTLGLLAALKRWGLTIASFKVGPDFIDPGHHTRITGRVSRNLDGWMLSESYNRACLEASVRGADMVVIEGVMGLYDGYDGKTEAGSTAQMAKWTDFPVLLVVNARSMARSSAAVVKGFELFDPDLAFAGVLFNHVGSDVHLSYLTQAMEGHVAMPCLGGLPRQKNLAMPERHLGLVTAEEHVLSGETEEQLADLIEAHVNLGDLIENLPERPFPKPEDPLRFPVPKAKPAAGREVTIGVARDKAFCFYYTDNLDILEAFGARIEFFSPLEDTLLPQGVDGLYFGGGYPELFAGKLSENTALLKTIREKSIAGMPVYGECGGFMYLCETLTDPEGGTWPMTGCLPLATRMTDGLRSLGYREAILTTDTIIGPEGTAIRGHEFHYSELAEPAQTNLRTVYRISARNGKAVKEEGFAVRNTLGSYLHLHLGSCVQAGLHFVSVCRQYRGKEASL